MLHFVGVTRGFNSEVAFSENNLQKKVRLAKGIYCDAEDTRNLPAFLRANVLRIANFLYPNAALMQSSAYLKGMVEAENSTVVSQKFKLFVAGTYFRHTHVTPMLEIVHLDTLNNPEIKRFCREIVDGKDEKNGRMSLSCASDELVFLMNFGRKRAQLERFLDSQHMIELRQKLETTYGNKLQERLSDIVRTTGEFGVELEKAIQFLKIPMDDILRQDEPANLLDFTMGWQGRPVAKLGYNGVNWSFNYLNGWKLPMQSQDLMPGQIPPFINNLMPEGAVRDMLRPRLSTSNTLLETSERFISNISIVQDEERLKKLPLDMLDGQLKDFKTTDGVFRGTVTGIPAYSQKIMSDLSDVILSEDMTRVAGMQPKIMMNLSFDGELQPASNLPATHILKFPGIEHDGSSIKGVIEWASMTLAQSSGMPCAQFALVRLPGDKKSTKKDVLGYVTERFDIPQNEDDMRMIFAEDICSVLGYPPEAKGMPSLNDVIDKVRSLSTQPEQDMEDLFKQIAVNYLLENADFHTKNASILKVANPMLDGFRSVRMAPAYDILRTRPFAAIAIDSNEREPMQLGFQMEDEFLDRQWQNDDFLTLGDHCGIPIDRAAKIFRECAEKISQKAIAQAQAMPTILNDPAFAVEKGRAMEVFEAAVAHCHEFFPDLPASLDGKNKPKARATKSTSSFRP
jgi:serine/threonine-protein kinase HipA